MDQAIINALFAVCGALAGAIIRSMWGATRDALTCDGTNWYECCRSAN